jgi:hypothetical protein
VKKAPRPPSKLLKKDARIPPEQHEELVAILKEYQETGLKLQEWVFKVSALLSDDLKVDFIGSTEGFSSGIVDHMGTMIDGRKLTPEQCLVATAMALHITTTAQLAFWDDTWETITEKVEARKKELLAKYHNHPEGPGA